MLKLEMPEAETERLYLRAVEEVDAADIFDYAGNERVTKYITWPTHENIDVTLRNIQQNFLPYQEKGVPQSYVMVLKENDKVIGMCDCHTITYEDVGEIGYVMNEDYWGQGYMVEAVMKLIEVLFEHVGLRKIKVMHIVENVASQKVIEACGFVYEGTFREHSLGKDNQLHDMKCYSILKKEYLERKQVK